LRVFLKGAERRISHETDRYVDQSVSAHHSIDDVSPDRRHPFKMAPAGLSNLFAVFIFVVLLCGTLLLAGRRAGYIIIFFGSLLALVIPVIHMKGTRGLLGGDIGNSGQAFFFVWTMLALGVTATFSVILSARALLSLPWAPEPPLANCRVTRVAPLDSRECASQHK
jgi:hypothetical protein